MPFIPFFFVLFIFCSHFAHYFCYLDWTISSRRENEKRKHNCYCIVVQWPYTNGLLWVLLVFSLPSSSKMVPNTQNMQKDRAKTNRSESECRRNVESINRDKSTGQQRATHKNSGQFAYNSSSGVLIPFSRAKICKNCKFSAADVRFEYETHVHGSNAYENIFIYFFFSFASNVCFAFPASVFDFDSNYVNWNEKPLAALLHISWEKCSKKEIAHDKTKKKRCKCQLNVTDFRK